MAAVAEHPQSRLELAFRALTREPESPGSGEDHFIHNKPPFVSDVLEDLNDIDPKTRQGILSQVVTQSHQHDTSYLMTMMMRKAGDPTGLMGPLIGHIQNPKEALARIDQEGTIVLAEINELPGIERDAIYAMFNGVKADWKAILTLDRILDRTNRRLKSGGFSQETENFRSANEDALNALYGSDRRKQTLGKKHQNMDQKLKDALRPTIVYDETDGLVHQQYLLPTMPLSNQEKLQAILPEEISQADWAISPYSPRGVMFFVNMAGHPAARAAAELIQELLKEKMKDLAEMDPDQVRSEAIRALMGRQ